MLPTHFEPAGADFDQKLSWLIARKADLEQTLLTAGAVRLRGAGASSLEAFEAIAAVFLPERLGYAGGDSPRTSLGAGVYTSTEFPPQYDISLHNELSYAPKWPARLLFGCVLASATGGETPIADSRQILAALDPKIVARFESSGVRYIRNLHGGGGFGRSWQATFETQDMASAEAICRDMDASFEWKDDGGMRVTQIRPATAVHPLTGERVWFNQADQYHPSTFPPALYESLMELYGEDPMELPNYVTFGDGGPIDPAMLEEIRGVIRAREVAEPWRAGDVLWLDNMLTAHGRRSFTGERKIVVAMA